MFRAKVVELSWLEDQPWGGVTLGHELAFNSGERRFALVQTRQHQRNVVHL
jgi:hypothetical protein